MQSKTLFFSSFNFAYLDRALVLYESVKKFHPDWYLVALICDEKEKLKTVRHLLGVFNEIVFAEDLGIPDFSSWMFRHDVVEACTAIKGLFTASRLGGVRSIIYLDPDIAVFSKLDEIERILEDESIVLTPHQLKPDSKSSAIIDNEITSLKTGIYNLGFFAVANTHSGREFATWWSSRLLSFCYDDIPGGLFVDQRWCDHVPSFFDGVHILKDPGFNVASWNLSNRTLSFDEAGELVINQKYPLRFWHFTKMGPLADTMTKRYARNNFTVYEIWNWYRNEVHLVQQKIPSEVRDWGYNYYVDGRQINFDQRVAYRLNPHLWDEHPEPFSEGPKFVEKLMSFSGDSK